MKHDNDNIGHKPLPRWFWVIVAAAAIYMIVACYAVGRADTAIKLSEMRQPVQMSQVAKYASVRELLEEERDVITQGAKQ